MAGNITGLAEPAGDRKMLNSSAGPSLVWMLTSRCAHSSRPAPSYGLSVTMPSVMLMMIGGNESGCAFDHS